MHGLRKELLNIRSIKYTYEVPELCCDRFSGNLNRHERVHTEENHLEYKESDKTFGELKRQDRTHLNR